MDRSIDFNNQFDFVTIKISNVPVNRVLISEFHPQYLSITEF